MGSTKGLGLSLNKSICISNNKVLRNTKFAGDCGEHLVAFDLNTAGIHCSLASGGLPYDLIADIDGILKRVQIKATTGCLPTKGSITKRYSFGSKNFPLSRYKGKIDIFAFVAIDLKVVLYRPATIEKNFCHLGPSDFTITTSIESRIANFGK